MSGWKDIKLSYRILFYVSMIIILYCLIGGLVVTIQDDYPACTTNQATNPMNPYSLSIKNAPCGYTWQWYDDNTIKFNAQLGCGEGQSYVIIDGVCTCADSLERGVDPITPAHVYCPCGFKPSSVYANPDPITGGNRIDCILDENQTPESSDNATCGSGKIFDGLARGTDKTPGFDSESSENYNKNCDCTEKDQVGCLVATAENYDANADIACESCCYGCTTQDSSVSNPDGSGLLEHKNYCANCHISCDNCCEEHVVGCMQQFYDESKTIPNINYNPNATFNYGCMAQIIGCMDSSADNYDSEANVSCPNNSNGFPECCEYSGCMDLGAISKNDSSLILDDNNDFYYWNKYTHGCNGTSNPDDNDCCIMKNPGCLDPAAYGGTSDDTGTPYNLDCGGEFDGSDTTCCQYQGCQYQYLVENNETNTTFETNETSWDESSYTLLGTSTNYSSEANVESDCLFRGCKLDYADNYCGACTIGDNSVCVVPTCTDDRASNYLYDNNNAAIPESDRTKINDGDGSFYDNGSCIILGCLEARKNLYEYNVTNATFIVHYKDAPDSGELTFATGSYPGLGLANKLNEIQEVLTFAFNEETGIMKVYNDTNDLDFKFVGDLFDSVLTFTTSSEWLSGVTEESAQVSEQAPIVGVSTFCDPANDASGCNTHDSSLCDYVGCKSPSTSKTALGVENKCTHCNTHEEAACTYMGCTDSNAFNYEAQATEDNSVAFTSCYGCTEASINGLLPLNFCNNCLVAATSNDATNDDNNCFPHDGTASNCCIEQVPGCTEPNAFNYNASANVDDGTCRNPCVSHADDPAFYKDNNAFATSCSTQATFDENQVINQFFLHPSGKHADGDLVGKWNVHDWPFYFTKTTPHNILGFHWKEIVLDNGIMHIQSDSVSPSKCSSESSVSAEDYESTFYLYGSPGMTGPAAGVGKTTTGMYCSGKGVSSPCSGYFDDFSTCLENGEPNLWYFGPIGTAWEDLDPDGDQSLPFAQITLSNDSEGTFKTLYGYSASSTAYYPSVEISGVISAGKMKITSIIDKTNGRNQELFDV